MRPQGQKIIADFAKRLAPTQQNQLCERLHGQSIGPALRQQGVTSNQELSQKRAEAVMQDLLSQGVRPDLVSARGL